jgi:hypothetical protein
MLLPQRVRAKSQYGQGQKIGGERSPVNEFEEGQSS